MAHETVIRSSLLVRDVQNPNTATQKFAVFTGSGNNDLNLLGFRTPTELLSDIGFNEAVDDRVSTLIQAGANISVTYDDDGNALIIAAPNTVTGSGTATQVAFWGTSNSLSGNSNLYWDNTNTRLGVGTNSPSTQLEIQSALNTGAGITGSELLTSSGWTTTGWTGDFFIGFTHSTGNTTPLSNNFSPTIDEYYHISITATGNTTGNYTLSFGGFTPLDPISAAGTTNFGLKATTTDSLTITPTSTYNGTLLISIKVASASTATQSWKNSSGLIVNELRAGNSPTNTLLGLNSGTRLLSGTSNVGIGNETFYNSINPNNSVGVGYQSLSSSDAEGNVAVGYQTLRDNTKGHSNTAIGRASFRATTSGYGNVGVGAYTGVLNTTGFFNVGIGYFAFQANTTGYYNVAIGNRALRSNTVGFSNLAVGQNALFLNTSGSSNTAFGTAALYRNTTGTNNIGIGNNSLDNNDSGGSNIAIGLSAGSLVSAGTANTLSTNSILIGRNTRVAATGQTNQVVIGDQAIGLGTNTTVIGNTGTTQTHLHGNLTLGSTNTPNARLQVQGADTTDTGWTAQFHNSLGTSNSLMIRNDGNVGIGTSGTTARLVVRGSGSSAASNALIVQNSDGTSSFVVQDDGSVRFNTARVISGFMTLQSNGTSNLTGFYLGSINPFTATSDITSYISGNPRFWPTSGSGTFTYLNVNPNIDQTGGANGATRGIFIQPGLVSAPNWRSIEWNNDSGFGLYGAGSGTNYLNGNLGIKTTTPAQTLHVAGTMRLTGNAGTATEALGRDANGDLSGVPFSTIVASGGGVSGSGTATQVAFWGGTTGSTSTALSGSSNLYWDNVNSRLGVGTASPSHRLHILGPSARFENSSGTFEFDIVGGGTTSRIVTTATGMALGTLSNNALIFWMNASERMRINSSTGHVGINQNAPAARLHVVGSSTGTTAWTAQFHNSGGTSNSLMIRDDGNVAIGNSSPNARLQVQGADTSNSNWTAQFHNSLGNSNSLMIRNDGNVGIGTTGTTARLVVRASGSSTGSTAMLVENSGGTSMLMVREDGNVGIGTNAPAVTLDVAGRMNLGGNFTLNDNSSFSVLGSQSNRRIINGTASQITNQVGYFSGSVEFWGSQSFGNAGALNFIASNRNTGSGNSIAAGRFTFNNEVTTSALQDGFGVLSRILNNSTNTVSSMRTLFADYYNQVSGSTVTNLYLLDANLQTNAGTITNTYGVFVGDITKGTQTNTPFSFYASDPNALNYFAGSTGIGTTTPAQTLDVAGTMRLTGSTGTGTTLMARNAAGDVSAVTVGSGLNLSNNTLTATGGGTGTLTGSGTATQVAFWGGTTGSTSTALSGSSNLYWDGVNGRLGVGTSTPSAPLTIKSYGNSVSTNEAFSIFNSATTPLNLLTVLENGNIGVGGQTSPIYKLDILGNLRLGTSSVQFGIGESGGNSVILGSLTNHPYRFIVNTNEAARFTTDRNLSIGATGSTARLLVVSSQPSGTTWTAQFHNALGNSNSLMIRDDGNVGIGTDSPIAKIDVRADIGSVAFFGSTAGSRRLEVQSNGNVLLGLVGWIPTTNGGVDTNIGAGGCFIGYNATSDLAYAVTSVTLGRPLNRLLNATTGGQKMVDIVGNFSPTSGNATFYDLGVIPTINQTGGASGTTRGLFVNPLLTSAADWRSIEWTNNTGWGIYGSGTAKSYFAGNVAIGTTTQNASSILELSSTTQGFLPPRMSTANRNLISSPATGLQVYNSSLNVMQHYNGVSWVNEANPILTRVSTGTTQVELFLDGVSSRFGLVGTNKVWNFRIQLCAIVASAGTGTLDLSDSYISEHLIGIKRSGSSINVVGGGVVQNLIGANTQMEDSVVTITGDSGTESLRVFYTPPSGAAANTVIRISATLYYTEAGV